MTEKALGFIFPPGGMLLAILFYRYTGFLYDDAYITLRYARNLVEGNGLVFNPGEAVLGTTAPFFAFWLAFWHILTPLPFPLLAVLSGGLGFGWSAYMIYRIFKGYHAGIALCTAMIFLLHPQSVMMSATGMETGVFLALLLTTYYLMVKRDSLWAGVTGVLLFLTRPEGGLFFLLLCLVQGLMRKKVLPTFLIFTALAGFWEIFVYATYGSWLPVSIAGKRLAFKAMGMGNLPVPRIQEELFGNGWNKLRTLLFFGGAWLTFRKRHPEWLFFIFALLVGGYLYTRRYVVFPWYLSPAHLAFFMMGFQLLVAGWEFILQLFQKTGWKWTIAIAFLGITIFLIGQKGVERLLEYNRAQANYEGSMIPAARWMEEHFTSEDVVMALEIGVVGFYTHLYVLDWGGLVSPQLHSYIQSKSLRQAIQDFSPDLIFFFLPRGVFYLFQDPLEQEWFENHYQIIQDYPITWNPHIHYVLFQKKGNLRGERGAV